MKFAYCLFYVFAVLALAKGELTEEQLKMTKMLHDSCVKETGASEDAINGARKGSFAEDDKLKCYMKCLFTHMGVFSDEDNTFDNEAFIGMVPEHLRDTLMAGLKKCTPLSGNNGCDMLFNLNKCFYEFDPVKYVLI